MRIAYLLAAALVTTAVGTSSLAQFEADIGSVPDAQLADMRGGLRLPSGLDIVLSVRQDTSIDGQLVLRTYYVVDQGAPNLTILTPAPGVRVEGTVATQTGGAPTGAWERNASIVLDRAGGFTTFQPGQAQPALISIGVSRGGEPVSDEGLLPVLVAPGGVQATPSGLISLESLPRGTRVILDGMGTEVSHLFGAATGTVIANTADNRSIDNLSTIDIDLSAVSPDLVGSGMLMVQSVAVDAARLSGE